MSETARIFPAARIETRVVAHDWDFAHTRAAAIAAHWAARTAEKPKLFDGRVLLCSAMDYAPENGGVLRATYFETSFSAFMAWRDFGHPDRSVFNGFAMAALRSADGAFLLGEMGAHTANAGMCYFPAGTPDPDDVVDDAVDLAGSVTRELREETGIEPAQDEIDPNWTIVRLGPRIACMRPVRLKTQADLAVGRVQAFLAREKEPELAGLRAVRSMQDLAGMATPDFLRAYLAHEFGRKLSSG